MMRKVEKSAEVITALQSAIQEHTAVLSGVEDVIKVAKAFDGKVMNKRFLDALEAQNQNLCGVYSKNEYVSNQHRLTIISRQVSYDHSTMLQINNCEKHILDGNRLNADKLIKFLLDIKAHREESISSIQRDIEDGYERLAQWNELAEKMNELYSTMSSELRSKVRVDFAYVYKS